MTEHSNPSLRPHPASSQRGAVLIIVLSCLVLLAALALGLLKRVEVDRANSASFRGGVQSRGLAEYAVNTVIAQISTATTQGANVGWASQPGMIRTFSSAGTNAYKLYSAPALVQSNVAPGDFANMDAPAAAWTNTPALWTDLNAPVVSGGRTHFPIVDASALNRVEGFTITNAPGATSAQPAPMPVQWLYVLEDGTLAPASGSGSTVTVTGATANNPIVGRIAFWTDDESAKININTASEGTFWDTPRVFTTQETNMAKFQPTQGEFQRYPGHPATVSLAPVFFATASNATPALTPAQRNAIFDIVPRINGGGSEAGTVRATDPITPDSHRLYANIDELIFNVARTNQNADAAIDREKIERARFFLTANSRAPEITLFNTPRVATWPVFVNHTNAANANRVTAYDRLLAFCATTAPDSIYYFQRQDSKSPVYDWDNIPRNQQLLRYLQALSGKNIPGFGASMEGKLGAADRDQLLVQMFDYIRSSNLYDDNLSPVTYPNQADADNAVQFTGGRTNSSINVAQGHGFVAPIRVPQGLTGLTGIQTQPDTRSSAQQYADRPHMGFGRFHTIAEAGLLFICNADGAGFEINGSVPSNAQTGETNPITPANRFATNTTTPIADANEAKLVSNTAGNQMLGGALLLGEAFLDVGYGAAQTGRNNGKFDWDDAAPVPDYPEWQNNGVCDFEPWDDANGNGRFDAGEEFWNANGNVDANGNPQYDGELSEPLHDYGRGNRNTRPAWNATDWASFGGGGVTPQQAWNNMIGARNSATQANGRYDWPQRRLQMMLFFDLFSPMQGWTQYGIDGSFDVEVSGNFTVGGQSVSFASAAETVNLTSSWPWGYHPHGGHIGFGKALTNDKQSPAFLDPSVNSRNRYGLISAPFTVTVPATGLMSFSAPLITVKFYSRQRNISGRPARSDADLVQTIELQFPDADFPVPRLIAAGTRDTTDNADFATTPDYWWALARQPAFTSTPATFPTPANQLTGGRLRGIYGRPYDTQGNFIRRGSTVGDTLKTLVPYHADPRLVAGSSFVPAGVFQPSTFYFSSDPANAVRSYLTGSGASDHADDKRGDWRTVMYIAPVADRLVQGAGYNSMYFPKFTGFALSDANRISGRPFQQFGDFDQGTSVVYDGAYINKPDEGYTTASTAKVPYFGNSYEQSASGPTFFSPNRQIPGPGMFGSLPTKLWSGNTPLDPNAPTANANNSWRTLLFRPQPTHPGAANPPDHLWMDLFWMPVVEPYAISEPFSTAGKINLNYAIAPFSYIRRATGMVALLRNEQITAIPIARANNYKSGAGNELFRRNIDIHGTLAALDTKFNGGDIYKSATEICDIPLLASGVTVNYATTHSLTGDNTRERPYVNLQTRLTTKSNVYTVHYRVEVLKKRGGSTPDEWTEGQDQVVSTLRGSSLIERFLDPNTPVPDYAAEFAGNANATPSDLGNFYRWRVLSERQFSP